MPGNAAGGDDSRYYDLSDTLWNNGKGIRVDYPALPALELPPPPADDSDDDGRHDGGAGGGAHDPVESHQARERRLGVLGACCLSCLNPVTDTGTYSTLKRLVVIYDESEPEPKTEPEADEPEPKA
ncbi:hypothetical protein SO694_001070109 [Aureococcus anophagefferens]|uniref:Uncharacterized protein n=1 Tax=Aureococcus anophagefferens TaxID=44056 RepID=A0ABR1FMP9_AURAN